MIRPCTDSDVPNIFAIVNDAAQAYKGVIPSDRWHEPYMPLEELEETIAKITELEKMEKDMRENAEIVNSDTEAELKEMAMEENVCMVLHH